MNDICQVCGNGNYKCVAHTNIHGNDCTRDECILCHGHPPQEKVCGTCSGEGVFECPECGSRCDHCARGYKHEKNASPCLPTKGEVVMTKEDTKAGYYDGKTEGWEEEWDDVLHGTNPAVIKGTQRVEWGWILDQGVFAGKFNAIYSLIESLIEKSRQEGREEQYRMDVNEFVKKGHFRKEVEEALSRTNPKQ